MCEVTTIIGFLNTVFRGYVPIYGLIAVDTIY